MESFSRKVRSSDVLADHKFSLTSHGERQHAFSPVIRKSSSFRLQSEGILCFSGTSQEKSFVMKGKPWKITGAKYNQLHSFARSAKRCKMIGKEGEKKRKGLSMRRRGSGKRSMMAMTVDIGSCFGSIQKDGTKK